ncbi:MAG: xanthine dehydrogenase family protein subunit M [Deltaproteobacteria bacterium]|jgi:carbon-monoxide dehydrogenase medium subunit|nr:xanthine dehydrogenase family protein subunit M [Deltaproteobacteria bacterium]
MTMPSFDFVAAKSLDQAAEMAVSLGGKCQIMAGGTDVMPLLRDRLIRPELVVSLREIPGLDKIEFKPGEGLRIGALATLDQIQASPAVRDNLPAVAEAAHYVASKQIRCKGTMAGNICNASPSADTACILIVMGAKILTTKREIQIGDFFKGVKKTCLEPGELVREIFVPELKSGEGSGYLKHAVRKAMDLAIIGVASWVRMDGQKIADCRMAFGGAGVTPLRALQAEKHLKGKTYSEALLEEAAVLAAADAKPISDVRASAEYRSDMIRVYAKRSFKRALETLRS